MKTPRTQGETDPAFAGIIHLDHFSPAELVQLRIIHKRVVRDHAKQKQERIEQVIQDNLVLKRLLLALRTITEPTRENEQLLKQIDERLRQD